MSTLKPKAPKSSFIYFMIEMIPKIKNKNSKLKQYEVIKIIA